MCILIERLGNPSYCALRLRDCTPTLTTIHFSCDILMTWSPEFDTHTFLLGVIYAVISSALLLSWWSSFYTLPPNSCQHCSSHTLWGNGIFICDVLGSVWGGSEEKKMKMKTEDARKKLQDWRYVGWLGWAGSIEQRSCSLSNVVVHEFWPWLQCTPNWLGSHSCWWRHYVVLVKLLMQHWFPLVASCLGSRRLVWPVYLPCQPTVCNKAALEGCGNWNPYCCLKVGQDDWERYFGVWTT